MSKSRFLESPRHESESKLLIIFTEREREREREREKNESPKSSREGVVVWCDGAG